MSNAESPPRLGEFELIARLFAPLARGVSGAFDLNDDVAVLAPPPGDEVVLKTDSLIEGVHFLRNDPPSTVGRKALRRALSDLAAKGTEPSAYLLALALPQWPDMAWLEAFTAGLAADQAEFGISLIGGETNATPGPLTITVTAVGFAPKGTLTRRKGAKAGDNVFVTGTIGDAGAGLAILLEPSAIRAGATSDFLVDRYMLPVPRLAFGQAVRGIANAAIDISDGLVADLGHIADVSGVRIEIDSAAIPLSTQFQTVLGSEIDAHIRAGTAGDDYEIAFTAPPDSIALIREIARRTATEVSPIGRVVPGHGTVLLGETGGEIPLERRGYTHF